MLYLILLKLLLLVSVLVLLVVMLVLVQEKFRVIIIFMVIVDMVQNVVGDVVVVSFIIKLGVEIYDYQFMFGDIKCVQGVQLIFSNGFNFEWWFVCFYQYLQGVLEVVVSEGIQLMGISVGFYSGKFNFYVWMLVDNVLIYVDNICDVLVKYDLFYVDIYCCNVEVYKEKICQMMVLLQVRLVQLLVDKCWLVISEGVFFYLVCDYGLCELYLWLINVDQQGIL